MENKTFWFNYYKLTHFVNGLSFRFLEKDIGWKETRDFGEALNKLSLV